MLNRYGVYGLFMFLFINNFFLERSTLIVRKTTPNKIRELV